MRALRLIAPIALVTGSFVSSAIAEPGHDTWMDIKKNAKGWSIGLTFWDYVGVVLVILALVFALVVVVGLFKGISPLRLLQSIGDNGFRVFAPRGQEKKRVR